MAKRARKYYLGLTTVTQDVNDFLATDYGKAVVTNSSMQMLLKQHPASIDLLGEIFYLSTGEKNFLLSAGIGEGLLFAGTNHVAMTVKASKQEHMLITTNPEELLKIQKERDISDIVNQAPQQTPSAQNQTLAGGTSASFSPNNTPDTSSSLKPNPANMPNPYSTGEEKSLDYRSGTISL